VPTLVRPRTAALCLRLDPEGRPADSDLVLATRAGEAVWRGQVTPGSWLTGLRMRKRCTGSWEDSLWLMTRALLETELGTHGLYRVGRADLRVDVATGPDGATLDTRCDVIPMADRVRLPDPAGGGVDEHVRRASRPTAVAVLSPAAVLSPLAPAP
jgi:hypothetical protein